MSPVQSSRRTRERETIDSTTAYLQSIGRIPLLKQEEEEALGRTRETADHLQSLLGHRGRSPEQDHGAITQDVGAQILHSIHNAACLLGGRVTRFTDLYRPGLLALIDYEPDQRLVIQAAKRTGISAPEVGKTLVHLSIDIRLLPANAVEELGKTFPLGQPSPSPEALRPSLLPYQGALEAHWNSLLAAGEGAKRRLTECNLRLVVSIARRYIGGNIPLLDLVQEGNTGLMEAVRRFNYRRKCRFSTYATWWIRQSIVRSLAERGRLIRLPVHAVEALQKLERLRQRRLSLTGQKATLSELAQEAGLTESQVQRLSILPGDVLSLDVPVSDDETTTLADVLPNLESPGMEEQVIQSAARAELLQALTSLPPREHRLLELRFGLNGESAQTLADVGRNFGISRERARQLEQRALRQLQRWPALLPDALAS
ncbi:MAG: sigma-70 family RNA polymerase sigma factor [Chloroflexi bacterium]|nr:sigma-70 family RNA polymerase sigma factor [Chloroflexota bacterium]